MRNRRLATVFAAIAATHIAGSAWAFDSLITMAERFPVSSGNTAELYFISPTAVAGWQPADVPGIGLPELWSVLFDADLGVEQVGFAFPELGGIALLGTAPHATLHLLGGGIQPDAVGEALLRRSGMNQLNRFGVTVFSEGEDNTIDVTARDPAYPFGGGWRSHRVAVWEGGAIVAYNWDDLEMALAGANRTQEAGAGGTHWSLADLVAVAADNAPLDAEAFAATGLPVAAFGADPGAEAGNGAVVPAFEYALYIASTSGASEAVQMVLAYHQADDAAAAANAVKARLAADIGQRYPETTIVVGRTAELTGGATLAIISIVYPPDADDHPSASEIGRWTNDVLSRRQEVLAVEP